MFKITQITDAAKQIQNLALTDGTSIFLQISYKPQQLGWFITSISYGDIEINNIRICTGPNILRQFRNLLPFGLACTTVANQEPTQLEDFTSNRSELFILTPEEVNAYEAFLNGI